MIVDGLQVMLIGMTAVFLILSFIVISVGISSRLVRFYGVDVAKDDGRVSHSPIPDKKGHIAAVISAAVARFRSERKRS